MVLILGSQSPRRKEILSFFKIPFIQVSPHFDEESVLFDGDPQEYAHGISSGKSTVLAHTYPDSIILTADTIVYQGNRVYGKPSNSAESFSHLNALVGKWHSVFTSLTIRSGSEVYQLIEETRVLFNLLTPDQIRNYHQVLPCTDKAGGYMIQGAGSIIINRIEGCYYNVMGMPINALQQLLAKVGIDLWHHLG